MTGTRPSRNTKAHIGPRGMCQYDDFQDIPLQSQLPRHPFALLFEQCIQAVCRPGCAERLLANVETMASSETFKASENTLPFCQKAT